MQNFSEWQYQQNVICQTPSKMLAPDVGHVLAACSLELGNEGPGRFYSQEEGPCCSTGVNPQ